METIVLWVKYLLYLHVAWKEMLQHFFIRHSWITVRATNSWSWWSIALQSFTKKIHLSIKANLKGIGCLELNYVINKKSWIGNNFPNLIVPTYIKMSISCRMSNSSLAHLDILKIRHQMSKNQTHSLLTVLILCFLVLAGTPWIFLFLDRTVMNIGPLLHLVIIHVSLKITG